MRKLPKKLRIEGLNYKVKTKRHPRLQKGGEEYFGTECASKCAIVVKKNHPKQRQMSTLLHEVVHVIDYELGLHLGEETITRLGTGLFHVLRDNKLKV